MWSTDTEEEEKEKDKIKYSFSTQAMCLVGLRELIKYPSWGQDGSKLPKELEDKWEKCGKRLIKILIENIDNTDPENLLFTSTTFGKEDVLTASWIIEYLLGNKNVKDENTIKLIGKIINIICEKFDTAFDETSDKRGVVIKPEDNQAGPHAFPLYLAVSVLIKVKDHVNNKLYFNENVCNYNKTAIEHIVDLTGKYLLERLHQQLSLFHL